MFRLLAAACMAAVVAGCSIKYEVAGRFEDHNEVFRGDIDHNLWAGTATIAARAENSGLQCRGRSEVTYVPPFGSCAGQKGIARLECDDGRRVRGDWTATSCTTGYGDGFDQNGNMFVFVFGLDREEADRYLAEARPTVADKPDLPVYRPKEVRKEKGFSTGTGFFVNRDGYMITNFHVIEDAKDIAVRLENGEMLPATLVAVDPPNDFALIRAATRSYPLPVAERPAAARGSEVMTLGYPLIMIQGQAQKATFGRINSLSGVRDDVRLYQIDVPIQPGNSGGPLLDAGGSVIGVVSATLDQIVTLQAAGTLPQNVNYAVKGSYLRAFLQDALPPHAEPLSSETGGTRRFEEVVARAGPSVALVVAR